MKFTIILFAAFLLSKNPLAAQINKEPFKINIPQSQMTDLHKRIKNYRWTGNENTTSWGTSLSISKVKAFGKYWTSRYDWKKQEAYLNRFPQFTSKVEGLTLHYVHQQSKKPNATPVLLLHGWASNFTEFLKIAELFKSENSDIDVIIPSLPGFGFSGIPDTMSSEKIAHYLHHLMTHVLGYGTYYVHGGDLGAFVAEKLASNYPQSVKGIHLTDIPFYHLYSQNENLSEPESKFLEKINTWSTTDGAYASIQGTKPKILSVGLNDSPLALSAWLLQLYNDFSDKEQPLFERFNQDELITNISIYWFTEKIYASMRIYSEDASGFTGEPFTKINVPTAFLFHRHDIAGFPPKEFVQRFYSNIVSIEELTNGGHFAGFSHPKDIKESLVNFIKKNK